MISVETHEVSEGSALGVVSARAEVAVGELADPVEVVQSRLTNRIGPEAHVFLESAIT